MANIYPIIPDSFNSSYGERQIFNSLNGLPDDWNIYYSVNWQKRSRRGKITWGEADFLIFNKQYGILVIEVKSGGIAFIEGKWIQTRLDTYEKNTMKDPFRQADRNKYAIKEEVENILNLEEECFIDKAVWFPSIKRKSLQDNKLPLEARKEIILTQEDLVNPLASLKKVFNYYQSNRFTNISKQTVKKIKNIIMPNFKLVPSASNIKDEANYVLYQLTNEQSKVLDFISNQNTVAIEGSAGTGKTFIAVEQARRCSKFGKVLFLCFNRFLKEHLKKNCKRENVDYETISAFLAQYAKGQDIYNKENSIEVLKTIDLSKYKYIIIDETQDFDEYILNLIYLKCIRNKIKLLIFYDKNQLIFQDSVPEIIKNFDCKLTLLKNCRNTERIAESINTIFDIPFNMNEINVLGKKPVLHYSNDSNGLIISIEKVIRKYTEDKMYKNTDITILTLKTVEKSILTEIKSIAGYKISTVYNEKDIFFTTAKKFKGLESNIVIVVDFNFEKYNDEEYKRNLYVALSRARQKLDVFTVASDDEIKRIGDYIEKDENLTTNAKIERKFKMRILKE